MGQSVKCGQDLAETRPNNSIQRTALRAAADAERSAPRAAVVCCRETRELVLAARVAVSRRPTMRTEVPFMKRFTIVPAALGLLITLSATSHLFAAPAHSAQNRQESLAIGTLRSIASAEATYAAKYGRPASLSELVEKEYLNARIKDGANQ